MRVFSSTKLGRRIARAKADDDSLEANVLSYVRENKTCTEDELHSVGAEGWLIRKLISQGLLKELTASES